MRPSRGFEVTAFEDRVAFRFFYESRYRSRRDRGRVADLVVAVRSEGIEPGRSSVRRAAGGAPALVQPRGTVSRPEPRGRRHAGPRRFGRPPCGRCPGTARTTARRVTDPGVPAAARVRNRAGDDPAGVGPAPLPAAPPLRQTPPAAGPGASSRAGASAGSRVCAVAPGADRPRPRGVLHVPAGAVADLSGSACLRIGRGARHGGGLRAGVSRSGPDSVRPSRRAGLHRQPVSGRRAPADCASSRTGGRPVLGAGGHRDRPSRRSEAPARPTAEIRGGIDSERCGAA